MKRPSAAKDLKELRIQIIEILQRDGDAREQLIDLVYAIDSAGDFAVRSSFPTAPEIEGLQEVILLVLAQATCSASRVLDSGYTTAKAARAYIDEPSESNWDVFMDAATNSYPFGPGDGCLALEELGGHGASGAGDGGAGFIVHCCPHGKHDEMLDALRTDLPKFLERPALAPQDDA